MAIVPDTQYPGQTAGANANYPFGEPRNVTSPGDGTGTPWEAAYVKDIYAFLQGLLNNAGIVPSGVPDTVLVSDYADALNLIIENTVNFDNINVLDKLITSGALELQQQIITGGLSGTVNDLVLGAFEVSMCYTIDQAGASSLILNGLTAPATIIDERIWCVRRDGTAGGTSFDIVHEAAGSAAANRFNLPDGTDIIVREGEYLWFKYNVANLRWELLFRSSANVDDLRTPETVTTKRLAPDGSGCVVWATTGATPPSDSVGQTELKDAAVEVTTVSGAPINITVASGKFAFYPQVKISGGATTPQMTIEMQTGFFNPGTSFITNVALSANEVAGTATAHAEFTHITASKPYILNTDDGEIYLFIFILMRGGKPIAMSISEDPPWMYNGPTLTRPDEYKPDDKGLVKSILEMNTYQLKIEKYNRLISRGLVIPNEDDIYKFTGEQVSEYLAEKTIVQVDMDRKNKDMDIIKNPFPEQENGDQVLLVDPPNTGELLAMYKSGAPLSDFIYSGNIELQNDNINAVVPQGVTPVAYKWKNSV